MKDLPVLGSVITFLDTYPRMSAWAVLSAGIVGLLVYEARDVGLSAGNWAALIIASIVVAGLCVWIVSWEDEDETKDNPVVVKSESPKDKPAEKTETASSSDA